MAYSIQENGKAVTVTADGTREKDVFVDAARGLFASFYDFEKIHGRDERVKIVVQGKSLEDLLYAWFNELIERQAIHEIIYGSFSVATIQKINNAQYLLTGAVLGETYKAGMHPVQPKPSIKSKSIGCTQEGKKFVCSFQFDRP